MGRLLDLNFRAGTAATWTAQNPTLHAGEPGWETDTFRMKIGDGATAWTSLPYVGVAGHGFYGDGSDGARTLDGSTTILGMVPSGNVYTLARDMFFTNLTINAGITLKCAGLRPFGTGVLINNGIVHNDGVTATSSASVAGGAVSSIGNAAGTSAAGTTTVGGAATGQSQALGGNGGAGGAGASGAGGAGATYTAGGANVGTPRTLPNGITTLPQNSTTMWRAGGGGGGGGGDGTNAGGGGGGGGGPLVLPFRIIAGGTGVVHARGGNGFAPTAGNCGGGGGGAGGYVIVVSSSIVAGAVPGQTIDAVSGSGGAGHGTGAAGSNGTFGQTFFIPN